MSMSPLSLFPTGACHRQKTAELDRGSRWSSRCGSTDPRDRGWTSSWRRSPRPRAAVSPSTKLAAWRGEPSRPRLDSSRRRSPRPRAAVSPSAQLTAWRGGSLAPKAERARGLAAEETATARGRIFLGRARGGALAPWLDGLVVSWRHSPARTALRR